MNSDESRLLLLMALVTIFIFVSVQRWGKSKEDFGEKRIEEMRRSPASYDKDIEIPETMHPNIFIDNAYDKRGEFSAGEAVGFDKESICRVAEELGCGRH